MNKFKLVVGIFIVLLILLGAFVLSSEKAVSICGNLTQKYEFVNYTVNHSDVYNPIKPFPPIKYG